MKLTELSPLRAEELCEKAEYVLEHIGYKVEHPQLRKLASEAGARVDESKELVFFPQKLLRKLLQGIPSQYEIRGILDNAWTIGDESQSIAAIVTDPWIVQYGKEPRRPAKSDVICNTRLIASMEDVAQVSCMDFPISDDLGPVSNLRTLEAHLQNHAKHYSVYATSSESFARWLEIGDALNDGKPLKDSRLFTVAVATLSPLVINRLNCELLFEACRYHFPVVPTVCPMAGSTSPYSAMGTLLQGIAENLAVAALSQLICPGNPFLFAFGPSVTCLADGHDMYYTMDKYAWKLATAEVARAYHLPYCIEMGGTMSDRYDMQSGAESMLAMLCAVNSGAHLIAGLGSCYNANGLSTHYILIQKAWQAAARHLTRGVAQGDLEAAVESLARTAHGGHFLMDDLTLENMRTDEFFQHPLLDYMGEISKAPSLYERADREVHRLSETLLSPVPEKIQAALSAYFEKLY